MTFFEGLPASPEHRSRPAPARPVWAGPPANELPVVIHLGQFLHRGPSLVMGVRSLEVYSTGCCIEIAWVLRRDGMSEHEWGELGSKGFRMPMGARWSSESGLLFGIEYADGRKAVIGHPRPAMVGTEPAVTEPVLLQAGGGGGMGTGDEWVSSSRLWLWPLPEQGDLRLVARWNDAGMPETSIVLDGSRIVAALDGVQPF